MFERQLLHEQKYTDYVDLDKVKQTKDYMLYLYSECDEALRAINFQGRSGKIANREHLKRELAGIQKYLISIATFWNIGLDEYFSAFMQESKRVERRKRYNHQKVRI